MPFAAVFDMTTLDGTNGFVVNGVAAGDYAGLSVASAGDVNGDGFADLIIGSYSADPNGSNSGAAYVVFGKAGGFTGSLELSALDGTNGFRISGEVASDFAGRSVASAGDINNDGFDDLIVGAYGVDAVSSLAGASYVIFGSNAAFAANINLSTLTGTNGTQFNGEAFGDRSGRSVASAGDFNNDGFEDFLIGAWAADPNALAAAGQTYLVFGSASSFGANFNLSTLSGANGFQINGEAGSDFSGFSVASAGDVNNDGFDDLIIGAYQGDSGGFNSGTTYVVFGSAAAFGATFALSSLDGTNGFQIDGAVADDRSGRSVASAGDINGDGFADLIIGAHLADPFGSLSNGASYVVFGKAAGFGASISLAGLDGTNGFLIGGELSYDYSGRSVSSAGDVNGDGFDDLIIGADQADPNGSQSGAAYVLFGKASGWADSLQLSSLDGTNGFKISGLAAFDQLGISVSAAGDVNNDGFDDIVVGAWGADPNGLTGAGAAYIIFGQSTASGFTGTGADESYTGDGTAEVIGGGGGKDTLDGAGGDDTMDGGDGNDIVSGGTGADDIVGGNGNDLLNGDDGDDDIFGQGGSNKLNGGAGDDELTGGSSADRLDGGADNDTLVGGEGNDYLDGGTGTNSLTGGIGNDIFIVRSLNDTVVEASGQGTDTIRSMISYTLADGANVEVLELLTGVALNLTGNGDANTLRGNTAGNILSGLGGADRIEGGDGGDIIVGGTGRDQLYGNLSGGTGDGDVDIFRVTQQSVGLATLEIDTIHDYELGVDTLDFSQLDADTRALPAAAGDQDFTLALGGFTRTAGEVFAFYTATSDQTTVRLDVDGDGKADYQMAIKGDVLADAGDWLL